jgi:hypothetical protein
MEIDVSRSQDRKVALGSSVNVEPGSNSMTSTLVPGGNKTDVNVVTDAGTMTCFASRSIFQRVAGPESPIEMRRDRLFNSVQFRRIATFPHITPSRSLRSQVIHRLQSSLADAKPLVMIFLLDMTIAGNSDINN